MGPITAAQSNSESIITIYLPKSSRGARESLTTQPLATRRKNGGTQTDLQHITHGFLYHSHSGSNVKRLAQAFDSAVKRIVGRTKINEQHLILGMVNDRRQVGTKLRQLTRIELAEEDGKLGVVAATFEFVKDLAPPFVVGDIVTDNIMAAGSHRVVTLV